MQPHIQRIQLDFQIFAAAAARARDACKRICDFLVVRSRIGEIDMDDFSGHIKNEVLDLMILIGRDTEP